jgi:hypothetical protein
MIPFCFAIFLIFKWFKNEAVKNWLVMTVSANKNHFPA